MFVFLLALFFVVLLGYATLRVITPANVFQPTEKLALSFGLGVGVMSVFQFICLAAGIYFSPLLAGLFSFLTGCFLYELTRRKKPDLDHPPLNIKDSWISKIALVLIVVQCLWVYIKTMNLPFVQDDAWGMWALRGKGIFYANYFHEPFSEFIERMKATFNGDYPLLISFTESYICTFFMSWNDLYPKLIFPTYYLALVITFYHFLIRWTTHQSAMLFTFFLATISFITEQATWGVADLPVAFYYFVPLCR